MKILAFWDDPEEVDLIQTYLDVSSKNDLLITTSAQEMLDTVTSRQWDVFLMTTRAPDGDGAFHLFTQLCELAPHTPVVAAVCRDDVFRLARFLTKGLRGYLVRDEAKDYMFLLEATLENAVEAIKAERERLIAVKLREEVDSVRQLQQSIIPPVLHSPLGYHLRGRYEPAQIRVVGGTPVTLAGGDYYNAFALPNDDFVLIVGDASGHGMKACLSIMTMHTLITMIPTNTFEDTASFVREVNRQLCEQAVVGEDGGFITLLYGVLNTRENIFSWTSAGHPMPMIHHREKDQVDMLGGASAAGLPLGIDGDAEYTVQHHTVPPRSRLLLYTDGIVEAFPDGIKGHHEFGTTGLVYALRKTRTKPLEETLNRLFEDSDSHTKGAGRHDDTSVLLLERD